jgi:predicted GIY-YIG superfamily endonuclease
MEEFNIYKKKLEMKNIAFLKPILCAVISWSEITQKLNKVRGRYFVYLLLNNDEVIYVGRSFNLFPRLSWHKYRKNFKHVYLAEYETYAECCQAEKQITKYYSPVENRLWVNYGI